jgi:hypothetical protein
MTIQSSYLYRTFQIHSISKEINIGIIKLHHQTLLFQ